MPAKPLTPEQLEDAKRLKAAFLSFQARMEEKGKRPTQEDVAASLSVNQSAVNQYLNGKIPLNADTLFKFCKLMDEKPEEISPSIFHSELERSKALAITEAVTEVDVSKTNGPSAPISDDVMSALAAATPDTRQQIENTLRMMLGMSPSKKQRSA